MMASVNWKDYRLVVRKDRYSEWEVNVIDEDGKFLHRLHGATFPSALSAMLGVLYGNQDDIALADTEQAVLEIMNKFGYNIEVEDKW